MNPFQLKSRGPLSAKRHLPSTHDERRHPAAFIAIALIVGAAASTCLTARTTKAEYEEKQAPAREQDAQEQRTEAERQRAVAHAERNAAQRQLATSQLLLGRIANSEGATADSLTWFHQAYHNSPLDDPRRGSARNLIGVWGQSLKQTLVHDRGVHTLAVSADGRKLLGGYFHSRAQIWDVASGSPDGAPLPHAGDIVSAQLSADGKVALIGDWDGAKVWDLEVGKLKYPMLEHEVREDTVVGPVFSPDGRTIVTRSPLTGIRIWNAATGESRGAALPLGTMVHRMIFSPNGKRVAAVGDRVARVWDVEQAAAVGEPFADATDVAFHPSAPLVAVSRLDGKLVVHDLDAGRAVAVLEHDKPLRGVHFGQGGRSVVAWDEENAFHWQDVLDATRAKRVLPHGRSLFLATVSPVSDWFLTVSPGLLRVWKSGADTPHWEMRLAPDLGLRHNAWLRAASFSPDGESVLTRTSDGVAQVLARKTGQVIVREKNVLDAVFSFDSRTLFAAAQDGWIRVRAIESRDSRRLPAPTLPRSICSGSTVALSPDGKVVFVVGEKDSRICRTDSLEPIGRPLEGLYHDYKDVVAGAAFSPDSRVLVTIMSYRGPMIASPSTGQIMFWDVATTTRIGEPIAMERAGGGVAFDATGKSVLCGGYVLDVATRSIRAFTADRIPRDARPTSQLVADQDSPIPPLWDDDRGAPTTITMPVDNPRQALLSADGRLLLILQTDGTVRLYDAVTGMPRGPEFQPDGDVRERSRNNRFVLVRSATSLRIWDTLTGRPCGEPLSGLSTHATAMFAPHGMVLATYEGFAVHLWDSATGLALGPRMELSSNQMSRPLFSSDSRRMFLPSSGLTVWQVPPAAGDKPDRLRLSVEVRTGLTVDEHGTMRKLTQADWLERKSKLEQLGGPCDVAAALGEPAKK